MSLFITGSMIVGSWHRWRYLIGAKHLVLHCIEWVICLFWIHRHKWVIYLQPEMTIGAYTQAASIDDKKGCSCRCARCGKTILVRVIDSYKTCGIHIPINPEMPGIVRDILRDSKTE